MIHRNIAGMGSIAATALVLIALIATAGTVGITQVVAGHSQIASSTTTVTTTSSDPNALPQGVVNQTPQHRHFVVDWSNTGSSGQDPIQPTFDHSESGRYYRYYISR